MSGQLDAQTYAFLARYGAAVRDAPDGTARQFAREAAVQAARRYHDDGVSWADISRALGIRVTTLRDWRGEAGAAKLPAPISTVTELTRIVPDTGRSEVSVSPTVLVALGTISVGGNDFPAEAAVLRRVLRPHGIEVTERCAVELGELQQELDRLRPAVLHLAAHLESGMVFLSAEDDKPSATSVFDLCQAIRTLDQPPRLVVLNGCDTDSACQVLTRLDQGTGLPVTAAVGWRGTITDSRARFFARRLYEQLAAGSSAGNAFQAPHLTVTTRWPGRMEPVLHGNALVSPFPKP